MSTYEQSYSGGVSESRAQRVVPEEFKMEYPAIGKAMAGVFSPDGKTCLVPAATINLFFEGGELRFCLSPAFGDTVGFGVVADPSKGLAGVEAEIAGGRIGWKKAKSRKSA